MSLYIYILVSLCDCSSLAIPRKCLKLSSLNLARWLPRTWVGNASRVNLFDLDFKVTQILIMKTMCSIISEALQAMPIEFAVKIVGQQVWIIFAIPMTSTITQGHAWQMLTCSLIVQYLSYDIQTWHDGIVIHDLINYRFLLVSMTLAMMQGHRDLTEENIQRWIVWTTKQAITE